MNSQDFWDLRFGVEVSALYHDRRRGTLWTIVRTIRTITLVGAVIALVTAFNPLNFKSWLASTIVAAVSILIAVVSLVDLVENYSGRAERHETLYRRFKELQAEIEKYSAELDSAELDKHIADLNSKAQLIRVDEPPTLWAIYAQAWNQAIEHHSAERKGYYRKITWWQRLLGSLIKFNPQDFPAVHLG
jgi:hypothetical protein